MARMQTTLFWEPLEKSIIPNVIPVIEKIRIIKRIIRFAARRISALLIKIIKSNMNDVKETINAVSGNLCFLSLTAL